MPKNGQETNLNADLKHLQEIADWFEKREEVDIEAALEKVKEAAALLKTAKTRLKEIENEFEEVKKELDEEVTGDK